MALAIPEAFGEAAAAAAGDYAAVARRKSIQLLLSQSKVKNTILQ
jgi:hypothetical protein